MGYCVRLLECLPPIYMVQQSGRVTHNSGHCIIAVLKLCLQNAGYPIQLSTCATLATRHLSLHELACADFLVL